MQTGDDVGVPTTPLSGSGANVVSQTRGPLLDALSETSGGVAPEAAVESIDALLDDVENALSRLDEGTYGECTACGRSIDDDLLAGDPTAQQCAECRTAALDG